MPFIETLGQQMGSQAGGNFVNEIFGLAFAGPKRKAQMKTAKQMQELQIKGSKELTDYNAMKQLEMWKNTNYGPQVEELKKAGLNPGLLYGMGGAGGATTNVATGQTSGQAAHEPTVSGMGITPLTSAQIDLMKAQTRKLNTESDKTAGVDTEKTKVETESLAQGIENAKAQEKLTHLQAEIARVEASVSRQTINEQMQAWENLVEKGEHEIRGLKLANDLSTEQFKDKVRMLKAEIANKAMDTYLKGEQAKGVQQSVLESQRKVINMVQENMRTWDSLSNENKKLFMDQLDQEWNQSGLPKGLKDMVDGIFIIPKIGGGK